ncbi:MAG TPA: SRPBCC family protein [Chthoniobacterales bacterium]|nr:SRPBCC family protein [Chthoniobacterales bacterium]
MAQSGNIKRVERRIFPAVFVFLAGTCLSIPAAESIQPTDPNDGWKFVKESSGVTIYNRLRAGSRLKEFKAVGEIAAPTRAVNNVMDDREGYPTFMPYTTECRLVGREADSILTYQRLSPKICADRDYTLRVHQKSWPMGNGLAYLDRWEPANEHGPSEKPGVFRVKVCEGSWLLEPVGAGKTRGTYTIYTDSGVPVPAFIANGISEMAIKKLFAAIRKQVKNPKYSVGEH